MAYAITTSIRLPQRIRARLERIANRLDKGKNGVIIDALLDYFGKMERAALQDEARRQSLLAGAGKADTTVLNDEDFDFADWK